MRTSDSDAESTRTQGSRGHALVEVSLIAPVLIFLLFGMIDYGRALRTRHAITSLSREAANLGSRGTSFDDAIQATLISSGSLDLGTNGYVILTAVTRESNGTLKITQQDSGGGQAHTSKIGVLGGTSVVVPANVPLVNQTLYVAEVFVAFGPATPIGVLIGKTFPSSLYDVAYF